MNRLKLVHDEGKSLISLVHIMLQVKVTFSLKFCYLGCFLNSFVSYLLLNLFIHEYSGITNLCLKMLT